MSTPRDSDLKAVPVVGGQSLGQQQAPDWTAQLKGKGFQFRSWDVTTPEGRFTVAYNARGMGEETIHVDDRIVRRSRSTWWYSPHFEFPIGAADAVLIVRYWPWLTIRWIRLIVGGRSVYAEGTPESTATAEALSSVIADRVAASGVEVVSDESPGLRVPSNITCEPCADGVTLTERWFSWLAVVGVPLCIAVDGLLLLGYLLVPKGPAWFLVQLLLLPGVLLGLYITYYTVAKLVNRTVVHVAPEQLSIRHGPLPWPGNRTIELSNVEQFECRKAVSHNYQGDEWVTYTLVAVLHDGRELDLLWRIGSPEAAHVLEYETRQWLSPDKQPARG
jgi:hypothetical protein